MAQAVTHLAAGLVRAGAVAAVVALAWLVTAGVDYAAGMLAALRPG